VPCLDQGSEAELRVADQLLEWMAADFSLTERALNRPSRMTSLQLRRGTVLAAVTRTSRKP